MNIKVLKRLVALTLMLFLSITSLPAFANTYSGGPRDSELDRSLMLKADKVSLNGDILNFAAGGTITFDVLLPFDTAQLQLKYEAPKKDVNLKVLMDNNSYSAVLSKDTKEAAIEIEELSGSHTVTFTSESSLVLKGINFHKVDEQYNEKCIYIAPFTDYDDALLTLVALKCNIGVVKTRNNLLRWDPEDIFVNPKNINGSIYVPAKKLAEALQLYCEDYSDLSYLYMLGETSSLSVKNGKGFYEDNETGEHSITLDVLYEDGKAWVPVRKVAELFGHTVGYQDGYVLIGDRLRIKKVFESNSLLKSLKKEFDEYIVPNNKVTGKTYHVAQTKKASDINSGSLEYPFLTIQKAADIAEAGDTIIIHEGTYREIVKPKNDGTSMAPITFKAAEGEKVVISALEKLSGFIEYKGDLLCATAPIDLGDGRNQIFYKGEQLMAGRHPNEDTMPGVLPYPEEVPKGLYATKGNIRVTDAPNGEIAYSDTDLNQEEKDYWKGGLYVTLKGQGWSIATGDIVSSSYGQLKLTDHEGTKSFNLGILKPERHPGRSYYKDAHESDFAYITNHINTVDIPGEWYMRDNVIFMIPPTDADLSNDFEIKQRQLCIDLRGRSYITFDGIDTIGGSMTADQATGCTLLNGEFKNIAHHTRQLDASTYAMYVEESTFSYESQKSGEAGFYFGGSYNAMINCTIDQSSAIGLALNEKYNYVSNNVIKNCSYSGGYPGNINVSVDEDKARQNADAMFGGHFITYNTLYNAGRHVYCAPGATRADGTYFGVSPIEFAYNRCFNGSLMTRDTGIIYEYGHVGGNDVARAAVHHNLVYDIGHWEEMKRNLVMLIYHDNYTVSRDTYSNVTYYDDPERPIADNRAIYVQIPRDTMVRCRNNTILGLRAYGESMLQRVDYPGARLFTGGADHGEYALKYMKNYESHDSGAYQNFPVSVKTNEEAGTETYKFKDVEIEGGSHTVLTYYMGRETKAPESFVAKARVYDKNGKLVQEMVNSNIAQTTRFYVNDVHTGKVILTPLDAGKYDIELELSDTKSQVYYVISNVLDTKYDNLYTKKDEEAGVKSYNPVSSSVDEETGKETFSFKDVEITHDAKTLFKLHGTRQNEKEPLVEIIAKLYNKAGELVMTSTFTNVFTNSKPQEYEVLEGSMVIPEIEQGTYDIDFEFSDEFFHMVRIVPQEADPVYDNLFDYPEVFLGGSYDDWTKGETYELELSRGTDYSLTNIASFNHYAAANCWDHTVYYKDRTISESANMLRVTHSTGSSYKGSKISLYLDTLDSTPIATWVTVNTGWKPLPMYVDLNRTLEPGTYTFIFKNEGVGTCATLWNFNFCNEKWPEDAE